MTESSPPNVEAVGEGLYRLRQLDDDRWISQFVLLAPAATLVVDTGLPESPAASLLPFLEAHRRLSAERRLLVLLTHPDSDHCGGTSALLAAVPWAEVHAHVRDRPQLGSAARTIENRYLAHAEDGVGPDPRAIARLRSRLGGDYRIDRLLEADTALPLGDDRQVTIVELPGHSPGHTGVWLADRRILIAADAVMGFGIPNLTGGLKFAPQFCSPTAYRATVARVEGLAPRTLLCAHEPTMTDAAVPAFLADSRRAAAELERLTLASIGAGGASLGSICEGVLGGYSRPLRCRPADLAMTVAGILEEAIASGEVGASEDRPRTFRRL
ncbi:MAG: MBL fold metallo-hydrolase [Actinobacteria bacterium]|nr:MBL fold metallo-hydrolase [Actinomycetota bacterium]